MKKSEIRVGGIYVAKISGKLVQVRVDAIRDVWTNATNRQGIAYDVTNLSTSRKTTFRAAAKFRGEVGKNGSPKQSRGSSTTECVPSSKPTPTAPAQTAKQTLSGETEGKQNADPIAARPSAPTSIATMAGAGASPASGLAAKLARVEDDSPHLIVEARAGTGKTTTLIEGLRRIKGIPSALIPSPQQEAVWEEMERSKGKIQTICFVAFNKSIAEELKARVPEGCNASTMHSLGYEAVRKAFGRLNVNDWVVRDMIADELGMDWREVTKKPRLFSLGKAVEELVGLAKVNLSDCSPDSLLEIADHYRVEEVCDRALEMVPKIIERCKSPKGRINFDDMIWLPVVLGLPVFRYDLLLVDEAQDLNRCQQALARAAGRRLILCGDARQAIYGFAGADAESLPRMFAELKATPRDCARLPLTVTRRCGKAIVAKASQIVPDFQAFASNPEGKVTEAALPSNRDGGLRAGEQDYAEIAADGDMVLCRINAPLVSECFRFLRAGRKATIQGRDVGKGLIGTCKKLDASDVKDFIHKLGDWLSSEQAKENAKKNPSESRLIGIQDRHDCLLCFASSLPASAPASEVERKIDAIFTDDKKSSGIRLSSIHKAKGLEARRVFILQPKNGPRKDRMKAWELEQEINLRYVAITRAIDTLVYVF